MAFHFKGVNMAQDKVKEAHFLNPASSFRLYYITKNRISGIIGQWKNVGFDDLMKWYIEHHDLHFCICCLYIFSFAFYSNLKI